YSHFKNAYTRFSLDEENLKQNLKEGFYRSTKDEIVLVEFWRFNAFFKNKWKNFEDFLKKPLNVQAEIKWRNKLFGTYNLSPIIILENILPSRYEVIAKSEIYHDNQEVLVKI
ncbi:TPA: diacylglucosamine hydrolase like protein, partial [Campylobacter jejuni]|nr:diacylglucosamine hydrolase like protein [Campylobacter jejuni]